MVGTGILSNNMSSPSTEYYTTFWMMTILSHTKKWLVWDFERKRVGDYGLVYQYFILIDC